MELRDVSKFKEIRSMLSDRQALDLLLVLSESRPGCLIMDPDEKTRKKIEDFCNEQGVSYRIHHDKNSSLLGSQGMFITPEKSRFEILENSEGRFYGLDDRDAGRFLGFPKEDVNYFHENITDRPVEPETREKIEEMKKDNQISQKEVKQVSTVSYVPKPDQENVINAMERGRNHVKSIRKFDEENDTQVGKYILEDFLGIVLDSIQKELLG